MFQTKFLDALKRSFDILSIRSTRYIRVLKVGYQRRPTQFFISLAVGVVVLWLLNFLVFLFMPGDMSKLGPIGDTFGGVTSLFTGAAFVGLIATLVQQQRELRLQRQELKSQRQEMSATREELHGQHEQMSLQNASLRLQMFEQTFFNMIGLFNSYIEDISGKKSGDTGQRAGGRDALEEILDSLINTHDWVYAMGGEKRTPYENAAEKAKTFLSNYSSHAGDLNGYFRLAYNTLKFVHNSDVSDKKRYSNLLRAQLSDAELVIMVLNCERPEGQKLKTLAKKYDLFKHLPKEIGNVPSRMVIEEMRKLSAEQITKP